MKGSSMLLVNASAGNSSIHGKGLIANEFIAAGTVVWKLKPGFDLIMTKDQLDSLPPVVQEQIRHFIYIEIVTGLYILCSDDAKFMNHADTPNTSTQGDQTIAIRDIPVGAELTCDYREFDAATRAATTAVVADVPVVRTPSSGRRRPDHGSCDTC
jgi:SET domain-containing protein